jgi:hypothetical protein
MYKCLSAEDWSRVFCLLYNFVWVSCDKLLLNERHRTGSRRGSFCNLVTVHKTSAEKLLSKFLAKGDFMLFDFKCRLK